MGISTDSSTHHVAAEFLPVTVVPPPHPMLRLSIPLLGGVLALCVLIAAILATWKAHVPFELRVDGAKATLFVDGQTLRTPWPHGITYASSTQQDPNARLFQVDGTDMSGTQSYNSTNFSSVASTAYYRFLCWLRDCSSYSKWQDFSLRDDATGQILLDSGDISSLAHITLPARFTLKGVFQRPDVSGTLQFFGSTSVQFTINPDGRSVSIGNTSRYYPQDIIPYIATAGWTITRAFLWCLIAFGLMVGIGAALTVLMRQCPPVPLPRLRYPHRPYLITLLAAMLMLVALIAISVFEYQELPRVLDGIAYYFQAKIFATGNLWAPIPPSSVSPYFPGPFMDQVNGHWFAHYPPGTSLAIALGFLIHLPWLVEPSLGGASVLLMAHLAYRWYGRPTALVTLLLLALSPYFLFLASSYLSHVVALFALLVFLVAMDHLALSGNWRWSLLAGSAAGYAFLTREMDAVLVGIPVAIFYSPRAYPTIVAIRRRAPVRWGSVLRVLAGLAVPSFVCLAFYFFFNWRTTGDLFLSPRIAFDGKDVWGFGSGKGWYDMHTPAAGFFVIENQLTSLLIDLFGWPYYLTLAFFFLPLATLHLRPQDGLLYGIAALFLLAYGGYFYHGIAFGPRYIFPSILSYILLTARGIVLAAPLVGSVLRRFLGTPSTNGAGRVSVMLVLGSFLWCNLSFYLPLQIALYHDYLEHRVDGGLAYDRLRPSWMHNAIVLTDDGDLYVDVLFPLNDPLLHNDVLYAKAGDSHTIRDLMGAYPHRTFYWINTSNHSLSFQKMNAVSSGMKSVPLIPPPATGPGYSDLAIGSHGDLFIANANNGSIQHVSSTGEHIGTIATGLPANTLFRVKVYQDSVCWADSARAALYCADPSGGHRRSLLQDKCMGCGDFVFMPNGDVVVAVTSGSTLLRFNARGTLLARTSIDAPLRQPTSIAATTDGHVFTYDLERHYVVEFDASLRHSRILQFGSEGNGGITRMAAIGMWLLATDPASHSLIAFNVQTGAEHAVNFTSVGDMLPIVGFGLSWNGHQIAIGNSDAKAIATLKIGTPPF